MTMTEPVYTSKTNGESGYVWRVYAPGTPLAVIQNDFPEWGGERIYSAFDCTGRRFSYAVEVRETSSRILAKQYTALDI